MRAGGGERPAGLLVPDMWSGRSSGHQQSWLFSLRARAGGRRARLLHLHRLARDRRARHVFDSGRDRRGDHRRGHPAAVRRHRSSACCGWESRRAKRLTRRMRADTARRCHRAQVRRPRRRGGPLHRHRCHILDLVSPTPGRILFGPAVTISYVPRLRRARPRALQPRQSLLRGGRRRAGRQGDRARVERLHRHLDRRRHEAAAAPAARVRRGAHGRPPARRRRARALDFAAYCCVRRRAGEATA